VAQVVPKTDSQKQSISDRLKQAFMFSALDDEEFSTVVDAIEEVQGPAGDVIITEGE